MNDRPPTTKQNTREVVCAATSQYWTIAWTRNPFSGVSTIATTTGYGTPEVKDERAQFMLNADARKHWDETLARLVDDRQKVLAGGVLRSEH